MVNVLMEALYSHESTAHIRKGSSGHFKLIYQLHDLTQEKEAEESLITKMVRADWTLSALEVCSAL